MTDKNWEELKRKIINKYETEKYRYTALQLSGDDYEEKEEMKLILHSTMSTLFHVLVDMSKYDSALHDFLSKELNGIINRGGVNNENK